MTQQEIDKRLYDAADPEYKEFNAKIVRSALPMIGVRAPVLKALAKEIARAGGDFFDTYRAENYEQILVYALALAESKMPYKDKLVYLDRIMPEFDNWAHVDMTVSAFVQLGKNRDDFAERYARLIEGSEFERRFMAVFLMDYCLTDDMIDKVFDLYEKLQCDMYYVNMAVAWGLSVALVKMYDRTLSELKKGRYNGFVLRKTVSKARDSYRISPERKEELKKLLSGEVLLR